MPITRTCRISWKEFIIRDEEIALLDKLSPLIWWEKFELPLPTISPEERFRRKLPFKNYLILFKRTDSKSWKQIISSYPPDSIYTVYSQPHWWSDSWDPLDYGKIYSASNIIEQIHVLWRSVPVPSLDNAYLENINSDHVNGCGPSKDCYLTSNSAYNEKCLYGWFIFNSTYSLDCNKISDSHYCSNSQHLRKCYNIHFSWDSSDCRDSRYIFSCNGCQNILGGVWLKNQKYQILNMPCTPWQYESTLLRLWKEYNFRQEFEKKVQLLVSKLGLSKNILTGSIESTGDFCYDSKNAYECYNTRDCEDVFYIRDSFQTRDSAHISMWWDDTSLSYDSIDVGLNVCNIYWSTSCWEGSVYNFYSHKCNNCQYIFGCSWLRNKSYCIFNKQYTKKEWENTVKVIIRQMQSEWSWGEFLDPKYAPFAYNESLGAYFSPLTRDEAFKRGFIWSDREEVIPEGITKVIPWERLPENISEVPDDVLYWAIKCPKTGKYFQIQPLELEMLRKFSLPTPRVHPIERIKLRLGWDKREFSFDF